MIRMAVYYNNRCRIAYLPNETSVKYDINLSPFATGWDTPCVLQMYSLDHQWFIHRPDGGHWEDDYQEPVDRMLTDGFNMALSYQNHIVGIYCTYCQQTELLMRHYKLPHRLRIGKDVSACDVIINDRFMSDVHGELYKEGSFHVYRDHSKNGTICNGRLVHNKDVQLKIGDILMWTCGVVLVYLGNYISLTSNENVHHHLDPHVSPTTGSITEYIKDTNNQGVYLIHQSPQFSEKIPYRKWSLELPPERNQKQKTSLLLTLGPSITMSLPMLMGSFFAGSSTYAASGFMMMSTASVLAVVWGVANHLYNKHQERKKHENDIADYVQRFQNIESELEQEIKRMYSAYTEQLPAPDECCDLVKCRDAKIWGHRSTDEYFLAVNVGHGEVKLPFEITVPPLKMGEIAEGMRQAPYSLKQKFDQGYKGPVSLSLRHHTVIGIVCTNEKLTIVQGLVMQLATTNNYEDLRIAIVTPNETAEEWSWLRWLPHVQVKDEQVGRLVGFDQMQARNVLSQISDIVTTRKESANIMGERSTLPHYVVFCTDAGLLREYALLQNVVDASLGITMCIVSSTQNELPKECSHIINLNDAALYDIQAGRKVELTLSAIKMEELIQASRIMASFRGAMASVTAKFPQTVTLLESLGIRSTKQYDVWQQWSLNSTGVDVAAVIGISANGKPFVLNLSDKSHGPHGLVAGTTGSGKSVLLQSLIMTLALRYHPDELQFVLIDYKGGGSFDRLRNLPHIVGMIDNLDGKRVINRALRSIRGEMLRREQLFKKLGVKDIHDYINRYNGKTGYQSLSHLVLIIDEFSELREELPTFMETLNSTARIGRTLGMHLILATQKPAGAVSPEIWSNSRFRICLRVQSREDSMDMLHRPEAANLQGMGRGYVQVGNNEVFAQVQTSWSDAPYMPDEPLFSERPHPLDLAGYPLTDEKKSAEFDKTQMDAMCQLIQETAVKHQVTNPTRLWLDELPAIIPYHEAEMLYHRDNSNYLLPYGVMDDIQNQQRLLAQVDIKKHPLTIICGRSASGKTTLLQTLIYSITKHYSPNEAQICIISVSGTQLHKLSEYPHVIDLTVGHEVREQKRYVNILQQEQQRREELFSSVQTDNFFAYNSILRDRGEAILPAIFIIADRLSQWYGNLTDNEQEMLTSIIRNSASSGIYFIASANDQREIDTKLRDIAYYIALQQNTLADYSDILESRIEADQFVPATLPGRGMVKSNGAVYEFQAVLPFGEANDMRRSRLLCEEAKKWCCHDVQKQLSVEHPGLIFTAQYLFKYHTDTKQLCPAALFESNAKPLMLNMYQHHMVFVYGKSGTGKTSMLASLARLNRTSAYPVFVLSLDEYWRDWCACENAVWAKPGSDPNACALASQLDDAFRNQINLRKTLALTQSDEQQIAAQLPPLCIVLDDAEQWLGIDNSESVPKLDLQLSELVKSAIAKGAKYNIRVFVGCAASGMSSTLPSMILNNIKDNAHGFALGATLADCNPWRVYLPYSSSDQKMRAGEGFFIDRDQPIRVLLPMN